MMTRKLVLGLVVLAGLAACRKQVKEEGPRDYEGVRQRSATEHRDLDAQKKPD